MDNTKFKNIQYGNSKVIGLPYPEDRNVSYTEGTVINAIRLNNTFNQLVDNDKAVVNQLLGLSGTIAGPKKYDQNDPTDIVMMHDVEDGYKVWKLNDGNLEILHKHDCDMQQSISATGLVGCEVYGFCQTAGMTFAATSSGIYTIDADGNATLFADVVGSKEDLEVGACYSIYADASKTLFATDIGIFQLNTFQVEEYDPDHGTSIKTKAILYRRNKTDVGECKAIFINDEGMLYVSASEGLFVGKYSNKTQSEDIELSEVEFTKDQKILVEDIATNAFLQLSPNKGIISGKNDVVALTTAGIYQQDLIDSVSKKNTVVAGAQSFSAFQYGGKTYVCTSKGLYDLAQKTIVISQPVYSYCIHDSFVYFGSDDLVMKSDCSFSPDAVTLYTYVALPTHDDKVIQIYNITANDTSQMLLCIMKSGKSFAVDTRSLAVMPVANMPEVQAAYASKSTAAIATKDTPTQLSVFSITAQPEEADQLEEQLIKQQSVVDLVKYLSKSKDDYVIATTKNLNISGKKSISNGIEYLQSVAYAKDGSDIRLILIDNGKLKAVNRAGIMEFSISANAAADTMKTIAFADEHSLSTISKENFDENTVQQTQIGLSASDVKLASDGTYVYVLDGDVLKAYGEAYALDSQLSPDELVCIASNADDDLANCVLSVGPESFAVVYLSTELGEDENFGEYTPIKSELNLTANEAKFVSPMTIAAATNAGLSAITLSADEEGKLKIESSELKLAAPVSSYCVAQSDNIYEFVASQKLSVFHDEYARFDSVGAEYGFTIIDAFEPNHDYFGVCNSSSTRIFDRYDCIKTFSQKANSITYLAHDTSGDILIATDTGLSAIEANFDDNKQVISLGELREISIGEYKAIKLQSALSSNAGTFIATAHEIYQLDENNQLNLISEGFDDIYGLDGYCTTSDNVLVINDSRTLKTYDVNAHQLSAYANVNDADQIVVIGDGASMSSVILPVAEGEDPQHETIEVETQLSDLSVVIRKGKALYSLSAMQLADEDISLGEPFLNNVEYLQKDFVLKHEYSISEDEKVSIQLHKTTNSVAAVSQLDGSIGLVKLYHDSDLAMACKLSQTPTYICYTESKSCPEFVAYSTELQSFKTCIHTYDNMFSSLVARESDDTKNVIIYAMQDNKLVKFEFEKETNVNNIPQPTVVFDDIVSYAFNNGAIAALRSDGTFIPDISKKESTIYLSQSPSITQKRMSKLHVLTQNEAIALEVGTNDILFACEGGPTYNVNKYITTLDCNPQLELHAIDDLKEFDGIGVFIKSGNVLSAIDGTSLHEVAQLEDSTMDFFVLKDKDQNINAYVAYVEDQWKYQLNGNGAFAGIWQVASALDNVDIKSIVLQKQENGINTFVVGAADGIYNLRRKQSYGLSLQYARSSISLVGEAQQVIGSSSDSNMFRAIVKKDNDKLQAFDWTLHESSVEQALLSYNEDISEFDELGVVNNDLASKLAYATLADVPAVLMTIDDVTKLIDYNDERVKLYSSKINAISKIGRLHYICTDKGTFISEANTSNVPQFNFQTNVNTDFNSGIVQNNLTSILAANDGIYTLTNRGNQLSAQVYKNSTDQEEAFSLKSWNFTGILPTYAYSSGKTVLTSTNGKEFSKFVDLPDEVSVVYSIFPMNKHEFYFGTDVGAYKTNYTYDLSNDLRKFTVADAKRIYDEEEPDLNTHLSNVLSRDANSHLSTEHALSSLITYLNDNFIPTTMDGMSLSGWTQKTSNETSSDWLIMNDMVDTIEFGDETTGDITIMLSNFLTSDANAKCSYVIKRYMSGIVEALIYVPTTNTYYIDHVNGIPGCTMHSKEISRQNLTRFKVKPFAADITKHYSTFEIGIAASMLSIDTLLGIEANGCSLPLKCYRDKKNLDEGDIYLSQHWHSFIAPTEIMTTPDATQPNENGEYKFKFACFGSDAQSVKIIAYDPIHNMDAVRYTVKFNSNGGSGQMPAQKFIAGVAQKLRSCTFTKPKMTFAGWTTKPNPSSLAEVEYPDQSNFSKDKDTTVNGSTITLYAIWAEYEFNQNVDNNFTLGDTKDELFFNHAEVLNDEKLGNRALIDYGK